MRIDLKHPKKQAFAKFVKVVSYRELKKKHRANSEGPNEAAHYEPPHLDMRCLLIQLLSFLRRQDLNKAEGYCRGLYEKIRLC